jgi:hypothetical protein
MVWHVIGITVAKAAVLLTTLQGARRPIRITATMVLLDAAWWLPELTQLYASPVCPGDGQSCQEVKDSPLGREVKVDKPKKEREHKMHQQVNSFQQGSAIVILHLVLDVIRFVHWCITLLPKGRGQRE